MKNHTTDQNVLCFESILQMTQNELKQALAMELSVRGYTPVSRRGFLYAEGELPVLLVAHMDTVHKQAVETICCSRDGRFLMSPEGIGGDDRCGVHMILEIIREARCHVLFTEDEEIGCIGARSFAAGKIRPKVNYIVEVDRRGSNDAVFYLCDNPEFSEFVCSFGFETAHGSFSDISVIAPMLGVAAVNISAGYYNEHSRHEYIDLSAMERNIGLLREMVQTPSEQFEYMERRFAYNQMTFEDIRHWDFDGRQEGRNRSKYLMPLPEDASLIMGGYESSETDAHLIDNNGNVYRYLPELDAAVHSEGLEAYAPDGTGLAFNRKLAKRMNILTLEAALELLSA